MLNKESLEYYGELFYNGDMPLVDISEKTGVKPHIINKQIESLLYDDDFDLTKCNQVLINKAMLSNKKHLIKKDKSYVPSNQHFGMSSEEFEYGKIGFKGAWMDSKEREYLIINR